MSRGLLQRPTRHGLLESQTTKPTRNLPSTRHVKEELDWITAAKVKAALLAVKAALLAVKVALLAVRVAEPKRDLRVPPLLVGR
jgi:hypothetical protein